MQAACNGGAWPRSANLNVRKSVGKPCRIRRSAADRSGKPPAPRDDAGGEKRTQMDSAGQLRGAFADRCLTTRCTRTIAADGVVSVVVILAAGVSVGPELPVAADEPGQPDSRLSCTGGAWHCRRRRCSLRQARRWLKTVAWHTQRGCQHDYPQQVLRAARGGRAGITTGRGRTLLPCRPGVRVPAASPCLCG